MISCSLDYIACVAWRFGFSSSNAAIDYNNNVGYWPATNQFVENIKIPLVIDQEIPETHLYQMCKISVARSFYEKYQNCPGNRS